ncbi:MAG TPA: UDP-N-acetylmuramate--L-alanine ligase [Pyrinomonadaceae bacterium]|jgi:UDP-N-acetylmuramate--alanine ligase|nr:UDP-N-acetylmuramate--L-alanine ligase [Pyrinomonadaceae bacterium]
MFRPFQHIHFVGIGGIGMSGIAEVLANLGFRVTGSDQSKSEVTARLEQLKVEVTEGHDAENVGDAHVVVRSTAVRDDNPEIIEARRRSIPVIPRAEMLAELMRMKPYTVACAGSHGKTTTTSMVATVLGAAGLDPTFVVGGIVRSYRSNARLGKSELMVIEADESDRSFLMLTPMIAVVTNIDREHMDYYHDMEDVRRCFADFVNKVPFYGVSVLCLDDPHVQAVIPKVERRRITYGMSAQADISAHEISYDQSFGSTFTVLSGVNVLGKVSLRVPGKHNVYNSLAAIAVALELDVPFDTIAHALGEFSGAERRFQFKGEEQGITVVDDYGHHPTEIKATLSAARIGAPNRRIVVLFQPHRYSRTADLMDEFASAFNNADVLLVMDIYAASETPIEGVSAEILTGRIKSYGHKSAQYIGGLDGAAEHLRETVHEGDLVITLGAGSVHRAGDQLLALLRES